MITYKDTLIDYVSSKKYGINYGYFNTPRDLYCMKSLSYFKTFYHFLTQLFYLEIWL